MVESYLLDYSAQDPQTAPAETEPVREAVTVVTGATESLGRALASEFASAGHTLVLVSANEDGLQHLAEELCDDHAVTVHAHACDLALIGGRVSLASALQDAGLDVEFLINAAGAQMDAPLKTAVHDDVMRLVDLNVRATTALTRRFLPGMIARGRGGILSVAAMGAPVADASGTAERAAHAYILSFTRALAQETRRTGVRVSVLAPGPVATPETADAPPPAAMSAEAIAKSAYTNFYMGQRVIVPGLLNMFNAALFRMLPQAITRAYAGWLLGRGERPGNAEERMPRDR